MPRRLKFKPEITRIKLNPEQAVLSCNCWDSGTLRGSSMAAPQAGGSQGFGCTSTRGFAHANWNCSRSWSMPQDNFAYTWPGSTGSS